jgi:hypothetical protein
MLEFVDVEKVITSHKHQESYSIIKKSSRSDAEKK